MSTIVRRRPELSVNKSTMFQFHAITVTRTLSLIPFDVALMYAFPFRTPKTFDNLG